MTEQTSTESGAAHPIQQEGQHEAGSVALTGDGATGEGSATESRQTLLRRAYGTATARIREKYRDEFETFYEEEADKLGVEYTRRLTPEQKAEQEMAALLQQFPKLRERIAPAD